MAKNADITRQRLLCLIVCKILIICIDDSFQIRVHYTTKFFYTKFLGYYKVTCDTLITTYMGYGTQRFNVAFAKDELSMVNTNTCMYIYIYIYILFTVVPFMEPKSKSNIRSAISFIKTSAWLVISYFDFRRFETF